MEGNMFSVRRFSLFFLACCGRIKIPFSYSTSIFRAKKAAWNKRKTWSLWFLDSLPFFSRRYEPFKLSSGWKCCEHINESLSFLLYKSHVYAHTYRTYVIKHIFFLRVTAPFCCVVRTKKGVFPVTWIAPPTIFSRYPCYVFHRRFWLIDNLREKERGKEEKTSCGFCLLRLYLFVTWTAGVNFNLGAALFSNLGW